MTDTVNKQALDLAKRWLKDIEGTKSATALLASVALSEIETLEEQYPIGSTPPTTPVQGYREALEWYGNKENYMKPMSGLKAAGIEPIALDNGERARQALSQTDIQPSYDWQSRLKAGDEVIVTTGHLAGKRLKVNSNHRYITVVADDGLWEVEYVGINSTEDQPGPSISAARPTGFKCSRCGADMVVDGQGSSFRHICTEEEETE